MSTKVQVSPFRLANPRAGLSACVLLALVVCCGVAQGGPLERADEAFSRGEYASALALYEQTLVGQPYGVHALVRSATLLSWENRLDEALERLELALVVEPADREAGLGRARVLSWSDRLDEAIETYDEVLGRHPDDPEARRGLARTLSWKGEYEASRREWGRLLDGNAGDLEALVGIARTYAWSSDLDHARSWYERALQFDPDNKDAVIGLGYVEFWSGDLSAAASRATAIGRRFPADRDAQEYVARVRNARAPWVRSEVERIDDTDDNRLDTLRVSGGLVLGSGLGLGFTVARFEMEDPSSSASIQNLEGSVTLTPVPGQEISLRLGFDRREETSGASDTDALGGVGYAWGLDRRFTVRLLAGRQAIRYSPTLTDNGILVDDLDASVVARFGSRWRADFAASAASVSDDNDRVSLIAGFSFRPPVVGVVLETGYRTRYLDYAEDLDSGYFDPQQFTSHLGLVRASGGIGATRHTYSVMLEAGVQSFTLGGVDVNNDTVFVAGARLGFSLGRGSVLELFAAYSDYAAQTAGGFESSQVGLRYRYKGRGH